MQDQVTPEALRTARLEAGLSQRELSARLGVRPLSVSQWELGREPVAISVEQLDAALHAPPPREPTPLGTVAIALEQVEAVDRDLASLRRKVRDALSTLRSLRVPPR